MFDKCVGFPNVRGDDAVVMKKCLVGAVGVRTTVQRFDDLIDLGVVFFVYFFVKVFLPRLFSCFALEFSDFLC